jgi:hypothetical protein
MFSRWRVWIWQVLCHHGMVPQESLQIWRVAANILNEKSPTADRCGHPAWGLGGGLTIPTAKNQLVTKHLTEPWTWRDYLARHKKREWDTRFGTWNVRSLKKTGSLQPIARELGKCKLQLMSVQEIRWETGGTERPEDYTFFYGEGNDDHQLGTGFFRT